MIEGKEVFNPDGVKIFLIFDNEIKNNTLEFKDRKPFKNVLREFDVVLTD